MQGEVTYIQYMKSRPQNSYGFIRGEDKFSYFYLVRQAEDLEVGDKVTFTPILHIKGKRAEEIKRCIS